MPRKCLLSVAVVVGLAMSLPAGAELQGLDRPAKPGVKASGDADLAPAGASLRRIRRLLRETPPARPDGTPSLLKLEYYIQVVGQAPRVDFFKEFKIGPATAVQYGPMTHSEFLRMTAPPWRKWQ